MTELWAARVVDNQKKEYFYSGPNGGFISKKKEDATFAFEKDQAEELGKAMLKFLEYSIAGKLLNSPVSNTKGKRK